MIAVDTSSMVAYIQNDEGEDLRLLEAAIKNEQLHFPPVVLAELLSNYDLPKSVSTMLLAVPLLPIENGFWQRAGELRASILKERKKARVADVLIAQNCIDHDTPLITRNKDFRHFSKKGKLMIMPTDFSKN